VTSEEPLNLSKRANWFYVFLSRLILGVIVLQDVVLIVLLRLFFIVEVQVHFKVVEFLVLSTSRERLVDIIGVEDVYDFSLEVFASGPM